MKLLDDLYWYPWTQFTENNCNSYLIDGEVRTLIDPGHRHLFDFLRMAMDDDGFDMESIDLVLLTHCHPDHLEAAELFSGIPSLIALHQEEESYMQGEGRAFYQAMGGRPPEVEADFLLKEGTLNLGQHEIEVLHTPGHSPGSICLYWPRHKVLISGDLVFRDGVGRTDFPGCSGSQLKESILKVAELESEWLLPGHGDLVQGAPEVRRNFSLIESMYFSFL